MKLTSELKGFYLASIKIPLLGPFILDPLLRYLWKFTVWIDEKQSNGAGKRHGPDKAQLGSYSAAIYTLQQRVENMEKKQIELQAKVDENFFKGELRNNLSASIFDGVYAALTKIEKTEKK
ncbi:MAG: hypothetical protein V4731_10040 [Pseudomonadota bacterium]